jgi:hypothetical protein
VIVCSALAKVNGHVSVATSRTRREREGLTNRPALLALVREIKPTDERALVKPQARFLAICSVRLRRRGQGPRPCFRRRHPVYGSKSAKRSARKDCRAIDASTGPPFTLPTVGVRADLQLGRRVRIGIDQRERIVPPAARVSNERERRCVPSGQPSFEPLVVQRRDPALHRVHLGDVAAQIEARRFPIVRARRHHVERARKTQTRTPPAS